MTLRRTGPGKVDIQQTGNDIKVLVYNFDFDGDALKPEHEGPLRREVVPKLLRPDRILFAHIAGIASRQGNFGYNKTLSARRRDKVRAFLRGAGVLEERFRIFEMEALGEAGSKSLDPNSDLEEDRSVFLFLTERPEISTNVRPRMPPRRPDRNPVVFPGSPTPFRLFKRGGCGGSAPGRPGSRVPFLGDDFTARDYPPRRFQTQARLEAVAVAMSSTDPELKTLVRTALLSRSHPLIVHFFEYFMGGGGGELQNPPGSPISNAVAAAEEFQPLVRSATNQIDTQIREQALRARIDYRTFVINRAPDVVFETGVPRPSSDSTALATIIHGTQGLTISIKDFAVDFGNPQFTGAYSATLRFQICDNFGFGENDINTTPLLGRMHPINALWVLQHHNVSSRGVHLPFVINVTVDQNISGSF